MDETQVIDSFRGQYRFLSNFSPHSITDRDSLVWRTNEHYYQASKTLCIDQKKTILLAKTPGDAKRLGKDLTLRPDWVKIRNRVMFDGLVMKFTQHPDIRNKFIDTYPYELIDPEEPGLGVLLMSVRDMCIRCEL